MEQAIPQFLQYGAMGILALAFVVTLLLQIRADKRAQQYARHIEDLMEELRKAHVNERMLIDVITQNTQTNGQLTAQIGRLAETQGRVEGRLASGACPFAEGQQKPKP